MKPLSDKLIEVLNGLGFQEDNNGTWRILCTTYLDDEDAIEISDSAIWKSVSVLDLLDDLMRFKESYSLDKLFVYLVPSESEETTYQMRFIYEELVDMTEEDTKKFQSVIDIHEANRILKKKQREDADKQRLSTLLSQYPEYAKAQLSIVENT